MAVSEANRIRPSRDGRTLIPAGALILGWCGGVARNHSERVRHASLNWPRCSSPTTPPRRPTRTSPSTRPCCSRPRTAAAKCCASGSGRVRRRPRGRRRDRRRRGRGACGADGVPLVPRSSGGGTVLLGPGCLLYSLVLRYDRAAELATSASRSAGCWRASSRRCRRSRPASPSQGISDLTLARPQVRRPRPAAEAAPPAAPRHAPVRLRPAHVGRYLREPPRQPDYRAAGRTARSS